MYFWPRAVEKMSDQGRQTAAGIREVSEKEKQELTEVLTKASLAEHFWCQFWAPKFVAHGKLHQ